MKRTSRGEKPWTTKLLVAQSVAMVAACFSGAFAGCGNWSPAAAGPHPALPGR